MLNLQGNIEII